MELLLGIAIGLAVALVVALIRKGLKGGTATRESAGVPVTRNKQEDRSVYLDLRKRFEAATSKSEYENVLQDVKNKKSRLSEEDYDRLTDMAQSAIDQVEKLERDRQLVEPKLVRFRALKTLTDNEELFNELHRIATGNTGILTYDELELYGTEEDDEWLRATYDKSLKEHFREMLVTARNGTVADYKKVMVLWEDLKDFVSAKDEEREDFVREYLASEWNEMIVRFTREPDWYNDISGYDELEEDDLKEILRSALVDHDLLNMRIALLLADDSDFTDVVIAKVMGDITVELETQLQAIGFKPGEIVRTV